MVNEEESEIVSRSEKGSFTRTVCQFMQMLTLWPTEQFRPITCLNTVPCADARLRPFVCGTSTVPPTRAFDEPVSISSVYDVAGLPTLMTVVYAISVFVIEKLDACLSKLEVV